MSRKSIQRDAILRVVKNTDSHPGADWVYDRVREEVPNISLGTVYRNLRLLAQTGEINELHIPGGSNRFDGRNTGHHHLICEKCNRIFDLDDSADFTVDVKIAQEIGFKIKKQYLKFIGLCSDCQKKEEKKNKY